MDANKTNLIYGHATGTMQTDKDEVVADIGICLNPTDGQVQIGRMSSRSIVSLSETDQATIKLTYQVFIIGNYVDQSVETIADFLTDIELEQTTIAKTKNQTKTVSIVDNILTIEATVHDKPCKIVVAMVDICKGIRLSESHGSDLNSLTKWLHTVCPITQTTKAKAKALSL